MQTGGWHVCFEKILLSLFFAGTACLTSSKGVANPCTNISAGASLLTSYYEAATRIHGEGQTALRAALSAYNTGDFERGVANGYVARVAGARARQIPAITPYTAETTVFTRNGRPNVSQ